MKMASLPKGRQKYLQDQFLKSSAGLSSDALVLLEQTFSLRIRSEIESFERIKQRAKEMREAEAETRKVAFILTFLVLLAAISLGIYLSDDRRLYSVHEFFAKWYYEIFVHDNRKGNRLFVDKDENYDMYA
ncbi:transmembrane protein, putative [Bodo saltans]|uniref:Transmembrane protein, putative n=1 Tax=Bodo saltans TaxID=75058 RepID=A0A0S4J0B4_BODSA|nr:transmembrane protein, putative [Bodo saltans]|eukprot:CUG43583.1 transmembrane protein, putative [Bodo saltans]